MKHKLGAVAILLTIGGIAGAATATVAFWNDYGWVFQKEYRLQHLGVLTTQQTSEIYDLLKDLKSGQDDNQDEWKCDELDEEIIDIQLSLLDAQTNAEKVKLNRDLEKAKERWIKLKCSRFEDSS
jgi:hypothetical protein